MLENKRGAIKSILLLILALTIAAIYVNSIVSSDITLNYPPVDFFSNETNLTKGFNFTFDGVATDNTIKTASCTLFIQNVTSAGILTGTNNSYNSNLSVNMGNLTNLLMNHTLNSNNTVYFWTIQCNASGSTASASPRRFFQDTSFPQITNQSMNFKNNTWVNFDIRMEVLAIDDQNLRGKPLRVIFRNGTLVIANFSVGNNTPVNLTNSSLPDGEYDNLKIEVIDPFGNINVSQLFWNISLDQTLPVITFIEPTPVDKNNETSDTAVFNFTITEKNAEHVILEFDGANFTFDLSDTSNTQCNITGPPFATAFRCNVTNTSLGAKKDYEYRVWVNDSANNLVNSSVRTFSVDLKAPQFNDNVTNFTISSSSASFRFEIEDTTPAQCRVKLFDRINNLITTISGTLSGTNSNSVTNCTGTFNASDIGKIDGAFTVKYNVTDGVNRSNETSRDGVITRIYAGWNLITYPDGNKSVGEICDEVEFCDQVAWYNNTQGGKGFLTYSTSTRSVNNGTNILAGEGIHIHLSANSFIITNDNMPNFNELTASNFSLSVPGWNVLGLLNNASMNTTVNVLATNGTFRVGQPMSTNLSFISWLNSSSIKYYSCKRTLNKCSSTSAEPKDLELRKGYAVWALPKNNITINRSSIRG